jgi:hypothetical protein
VPVIVPSMRSAIYSRDTFSIFHMMASFLSCYYRGMKKLIILSLVLLVSSSAFARTHHHRHHRAHHYHRQAQ